MVTGKTRVPAGNQSEMIVLHQGLQQTFRHRCEDIQIPGHTALALPVRQALWRLNQGAPVHVYVERTTSPADPERYPWKTRTPAVNRLRDRPGHFNIEIPIVSPDLRPGRNVISLNIEGGDGQSASIAAEFTWDPTPVDLPLELGDPSQAASIQDLGQVVDGRWGIDRIHNAITTLAPVADDALLLLGGPHRSQEATYNVEFSSPLSGVFLGLSDFFVRHDEQEPDLGIKPGYSTAGLATLRPKGVAECWAAMGDSTRDMPWSWVEKTPPRTLSVAAGVVYRVCHQVIFDGDTVLSRFRIWPADRAEPSRWLCTVHTAELPMHLPRPTAASFGLFQYHGTPTRWSNIRLRPIEARLGPQDFAESRTWREILHNLRHKPKRFAWGASQS